MQTDEVDIDIILSPTQALSFRERINADGTDARAIDGALDGIESAEAETSVPADTESIRALIQSYAGGFGTLNDAVKRYLRRWFESQGGVKVVARRGRAAGRAGRVQPVQRPGRVERVPVARFVDSVNPASSSATTTAPTTATTAAARGPVVSRFVGNPAYDVQGAYEDMRDPGAAITLPGSPLTRRLAPTTPRATVGRSQSGRSRTSSAAVRLLGIAADATYEDVLPAASAGALSGVGSSVGRGRQRVGVDGGYMEVEGTPLPPPGRHESAFSLIADAGLGRQDSDVSLIDIANLGIIPRRLSSQSEL